MSDEMEGEGLRSGQAIRDYIARLRLCAEIDRLKAGRFTPEEFQNLCHHLDETKRASFYQGCADYQRKLFGVSDRDLLQGVNADTREAAETATASNCRVIHEQREEAERVRREVKAAQELLGAIPPPKNDTIALLAFETALLRLERALDITGEYRRENKARQKQAIASESKSP